MVAVHTLSHLFLRTALPDKGCLSLLFIRAFPNSSVGKESACNAGDSGSIPGSGRPPGEGIGYPTPVFLGFSCGLAGKESACNALMPWSGRFPGEGKGYPFQYSGLENSMDCIAHGVSKSWTGLSDFHFHFLFSSLLLGEQTVFQRTR